MPPSRALVINCRPSSPANSLIFGNWAQIDLFRAFSSYFRAIDDRVPAVMRAEHLVMSLSRIAFAFALAAAPISGLVIVAAPAYAQPAANLSGVWQGAYLSADGADVNTFTVTLTQIGTRLTGSVTELNAFGDQSKAIFLTSTLAGTINGNQVLFTKTYDGSGGVSHSVVYRGEIQPGGRRVRGVFQADAATGTFEMVR